MSAFVAAARLGRGFKHSAGGGEAVAALAATGRSPLARFPSSGLTRLA